MALRSSSDSSIRAGLSPSLRIAASAAADFRSANRVKRSAKASWRASSRASGAASGTDALTFWTVLACLRAAIGNGFARTSHRRAISPTWVLTNFSMKVWRRARSSATSGNVRAIGGDSAFRARHLGFAIEQRQARRGAPAASRSPRWPSSKPRRAAAPRQSRPPSSERAKKSAGIEHGLRSA